MSRRVLLAWLFLGLVVSTARAQVPYGEHLIPTRTALGRIGLERHWVGVVPLSGVERLIEISIADNLLFAQTNQANFSVYNAESGQLLWSMNLGAKTGDAQPASANSFAVFVTNSNRLFALDRQTGRPYWIHKLENLPTSPTSCDERKVMVGLTTGKVVAYGLKKKIEKGPEQISPAAIFLWNWQTNGPIIGRAIPAGPVIAFGGLDGRAYLALDEPPKVLWRFETGGQIAAAMGGYGTRTLLVPSTDKNLYAVDLWTAETKWSFPSGAPVRQEPLVAGEDVYVANDAGLLTAIDGNSGLQRWSTSTHGGRLISVSEKRVYLESHDEDLFIVDRASGQIVADPRATLSRAGVNIRDYSLGITNNLNDRLYFATNSGLIICLRETGQVNPRPIRDPKAPPFGYVPAGGIKLPRDGEAVQAQPAAEAAPPPAGEEGDKAEGKNQNPDEKDKEKAEPEKPDDKE